MVARIAPPAVVGTSVSKVVINDVEDDDGDARSNERSRRDLRHWLADILCHGAVAAGHRRPGGVADRLDVHPDAAELVAVSCQLSAVSNQPVIEGGDAVRSPRSTQHFLLSTQHS